jgi:transglutaminase-like putative cysteine protease
VKKYQITHLTEYDYMEAVNLCHNRLCLFPKETAYQQCHSQEVEIFPKPDEMTMRFDYFGNQVLFFSIYKEHQRLKIISKSVVSLNSPSVSAFSQPFVPSADIDLALRTSPERLNDVSEFLIPSTFIPRSPVLADFAKDAFEDGRDLMTGCLGLMEKIFNTISFTPGFTTIYTPVLTVLKEKKGVCQDLAHLMIACLRQLGIPARYVSGYLETLPPEGKEKLQGSDASHAWVSVFFPSVGWVEFDPTNNLIPGDRHIVLAYGRDYHDVAPTKGIVFSSGDQKLKVSVDVQPI